MAFPSPGFAVSFTGLRPTFLASTAGALRLKSSPVRFLLKNHRKNPLRLPVSPLTPFSPQNKQTAGSLAGRPANLCGKFIAQHAKNARHYL
jgi:hypothetical protein